MADPAGEVVALEGLTILDGTVPGDTEVDYVFLHGLNGNPKKTWSYGTDDDGGFFWPRQILVDIPGCRVMTFGYNAAFERALVENTTTIGSIAQTFISRLIDKRTGVHINRPLVLIAHSLGGLVIKKSSSSTSQALCNIHADRHTGLQTRKIKEQNAIYDSIAGLVFIGTPHAGSHVADTARVKMLKALARATFKKAPENLVRALSAHSNELQDLSSSFERTTIFTQHVIEICTYYETKTTKFAGEEVVPQAMTKLHYLNEREEGIAKEHTKMAKFPHAQDDTYQSVAQRLKDMGADGLNAQRARQATYRVSQIPGDILKSQIAQFLSTCGFSHDQGQLGPASNIRVHSLAARLGQRRPIKTATVTFLTLPPLLANGECHWIIPFVREGTYEKILIDVDFHGFTDLNDVEPEDHVLDLIAIPGLGYHPFSTWQEDLSTSPYMWLRDSLPLLAHGTRVLLYGYESKHQDSRNSLTVQSIAISLIRALHDLGCSSLSAKPLAFLAHSLGGIVLKQCLVELANAGQSEMFILQRVKMCIFLGVPNGLPSPSRLAAMPGSRNFDTLLDQLQADRNLDYLPTLDAMVRGYGQANCIRLCSGYEDFTVEKQNPDDAGVSALILSKAQALQDGSKADIFPIPKPHRSLLRLRVGDEAINTIARFVVQTAEACAPLSPQRSGQEESTLRQPSFISTALRQLKSYINVAPLNRITGEVNLHPHAEEIGHDTESIAAAEIRNSPFYRQFLSTLTLFGREREEGTAVAYPGTLEWVWTNPDIHLSSWLADGASPLFWIRGLPGSGKSTLMRYIWDHKNLSTLLEDGTQDLPRIKSAFFFYYRGNHIQKSFEGMMHSVLLRILDQEPRLANVLLPDFVKLEPQQRDRWQWTLPKLMKAYEDILTQDYLPVEIFLFLDALDEYDGPPEAIVDFIHSSVTKSTAGKTRLKICFSSREWPSFEDSFSAGPGFRIHEHTNGDIRNYVLLRFTHNTRVSQLLASGTDQERSDILAMEEDVTGRANGVFVWVKAVTDEVLNGFSRNVPTSELLALLKNFPRDLNLFYEEAIRRVPYSMRQEAFIMFEVIARCDDILNVVEIREAVSCAPYDNLRDCFEAARQYWGPAASDSAIRWIRERGAGLVELESAQITTGFVFATFMHQTVLDFVSSPGFRGLILDHSYSLPLINGYTVLSKWLFVTGRQSIEEGPSFARGWAMDLLTRSEETTGKSMKHFLNSLDVRDFEIIWDVLGFPAAEISNPKISFAVTYGLKLFIQETIEEHNGVIPDQGKFSLLHCLSMKRRYNASISANAQVLDSSSPLDIIPILIRHGARLNSTWQGSGSDYNDDYEATFVRHLLSAGEDPDTDILLEKNTKRSKEQILCRPLHVAGQGVAEVLLLFNASVNALDSKGRTPLDLACGVGGNPFEIGDHVDPARAYALVALLLSHGALLSVEGQKIWPIFASLTSDMQFPHGLVETPGTIGMRFEILTKAKDFKKRLLKTK
ncbi:SERAC1 protein [Paramyrothecium foliicola]|nr:SERAC1 protein [Paramyrothecium foliicola]